ncbi:MAG TPA: sulfatase-like hydrolase/transferase [Flavisolibacter sp.]|nr:sulfatase-like hydrolase/transferase [Flavisolibacter sp.]
MKKFVVFHFLLFAFLSHAQQSIPSKPILPYAENIVIVTTDGFRWQEVFSGMDSAIANNNKYNEDDSSYIYKEYWNAEIKERRKKLMPFLWSVVVNGGQLYGNRSYGNKVNTANPYWFSYPGYSEILTGYVDTAINSNEYPPNPNSNVLEYLNKQPGFKGKVSVFGAWNAFDRILNEKRSGIPVMSAFDKIGGKLPDANEQLINKMRDDSYKPWGKGECLDVFTHYAAVEEFKKKKPRVLYIAYGETDEWAHSGKYRSYLDAAHQVDAWIGQLWKMVQADPQYRNKTTLFITTDHGRGDAVKEQWRDHGSKVAGANEIWFAVIGPHVSPQGEVTTETQLFQQQFAQTIAELLGFTFKTGHPVAPAISGVAGR